MNIDKSINLDIDHIAKVNKTSFGMLSKSESIKFIKLGYTEKLLENSMFERNINA